MDDYCTAEAGVAGIEVLVDDGSQEGSTEAIREAAHKISEYEL
jgi:hypothetical protein